MSALSRILAVFVALVVLAGAGNAGAQGPSILFDPATGEVLSQDRAGEPWYPASLTKLMTAYVIFGKLRDGRLTLEQKLAVSPLAASMPPSKIGMRPGSSVSVDFALQTLLVYSANDMAYVLAEGAGITKQAFVAEMNATANRLGMTGTHFVNPNGLFEPRQVTTARDLAILVSAILREYPDRAHYFSQPYVAVGKRRLANRNSLIRQMPDADGMKTGFVCNSGFNLAASATRDGRKLAAVVLGAPSGKARADLAQMLLTSGFLRPPMAQRQQVADLRNVTVGAIVPADLTTAVCRQKIPVTLVSAHDLAGFGISFGQYDTAQKADMALRGRLLHAAAANASGNAGIIRMPGAEIYSAILWNLGQQASEAICATFRSENAYCDVMTPEAFARIAALSPVPQAAVRKPAPPVGDDDTPPEKPKKKKP